MKAAQWYAVQESVHNEDAMKNLCLLQKKNYYADTINLKAAC
jgi:hypothetical protein